MEHGDNLEERQVENRRKWDISRRKLLQLLGSAAVTAVAAPLAIRLRGGEGVQAAEEGSPEAGAAAGGRWS